MDDIKALFKKNQGWPLAQQIALTLQNAGIKAYLAGGCVRDALLGQVPKDFDIATSARPEQVLKFFPASRPQGKAFGVVAVFNKHSTVEVATFRKDGPYKDGRHPENVVFLSEKEDALRRDFTINALFYDLKTHKIIDYVGGQADIKNKVIRAVGDPATRFKEDHLRILRALRFKLRLNFQIEANTRQSLFKMKKALLAISKERVLEECFKILQAGQGQGAGQWIKALSALKELGLLTEFTGRTEKDIDWPFCERFWEQKPPLACWIKDKETKDKLAKEKVFLWTYALFPILYPAEQKGPLYKGQWYKSRLREWKFPLKVIKGLGTVLEGAGHLIGFTHKLDLPSSKPAKCGDQNLPPHLAKFSAKLSAKLSKVGLGKQLRLLSSPLAQDMVFMSKAFLKSRGLSVHSINQLEKEFKARSTNGRLPKPLLNGDDLKALGFKADKTLAGHLDFLYNVQLEHNITSKKELISKTRKKNLK